MSEFTVTGTVEEPARVDASDLTAALRRRDDIVLMNCSIAGAVTLRRARVCGMLEVQCCSFADPVAFEDVIFEGQLQFRATEFQKMVVFTRSRLEGLFYFAGCRFLGGLSCDDSTYLHQLVIAGGELSCVSILRAKCERPVDFLDCDIGGFLQCQGTEFVGGLALSNVKVGADLQLDYTQLRGGLALKSVELLRGASLEGATLAGPVSLDARYCGDIPWWRRAWSWLSRCPLPPRINVIGTNAQSCDNLVISRWVRDTNWLVQWRQLHPVLFRAWLVTSDCGRSLVVWLLWALGISTLFGAAYSGLEAPAWLPSHAAKLLVALRPELHIGSAPTWFAPYYYSIVAFSTLGFGDIYPTNTSGQVLVAVEALTGYMMLGGLLAILANKIARRS